MSERIAPAAEAELPLGDALPGCPEEEEAEGLSRHEILERGGVVAQLLE